jgi:hypothetical protein
VSPEDRLALAAEHLRDLYPNPSGGELVLFTLPGAGHERFTDAAEAAAWGVAKSDAGLDVYVQMGRVPSDVPGRGKAEEIIALPGAWAEIDLAAGVHAAGNLPTSADEALAIVRRAVGEPTRVNHSGGGLHCYWLASSGPWAKGSIAATEGVDAAIRAEFDARGWTLDNVTDAARVLRLAGTWNYKGPEPLLVRPLQVDGPRHEYGALTARCPVPAPVKKEGAAYSGDAFDEWSGPGDGLQKAVDWLERKAGDLASTTVERNKVSKALCETAGGVVAAGLLTRQFTVDTLTRALDTAYADEDRADGLDRVTRGVDHGIGTGPVPFALEWRKEADLPDMRIVEEPGAWVPIDQEALEAFIDGAVSRVSDVLSRPAVEWWPGLEGLLQKGVTSEIVAASGGGKSLWTLQHCVDLAQRGVRVLYCALEGQAGFNGRLRAQIIERCVDALPGVEGALREALEEQLYFYDLRVALAGGDVATSVEKLRRTAEGLNADIVVIDTLIRAAPGVDENDNAQMQGVVDAADLLRYREGVSVWLIRHAGHDQNRGRGASSVYAALDNSVFISPIGNHDGKDGRPLIVRVRADKVKDGRQAHGLVYRRHELVLGKLHDGTDWTSVVFRPEHDLDEDQNADWTTVLELIDENTDHEDGTGVTSAHVKAATQWSSGKVGKVLKEMVEANRINRSKEGKGSFVYTR